MNSMVQQAQSLAKQGCRVFPVGAEKQPLVRGGFKAASCDPVVVAGMWKKRANANIGIATGLESGLVVIDVDVKGGHDGFGSLKELEREYGPLVTRKVSTPSGGIHLIFSINQDVRSRTGVLDGIDIRGDGGYIVAQGSKLDNGVYKVIVDVEPIPMPPDLVDFINSSSGSVLANSAPVQGSRNDHVFRLASACRGKGESYEQTIASCNAAGLECSPPLDSPEIKKIVTGVYERYEPAGTKVTKESITAQRSRWQREIRIEWAKCDMDMRYAMITSMPPSGFIAYEKVSLALWYRGRLSRPDFVFTAGLEGDELDSVTAHFTHSDGWYQSDVVNDMYEDSYCRIMTKRASGSLGGRPKTKNL